MSVQRPILIIRLILPIRLPSALSIRGASGKTTGASAVATPHIPVQIVAVVAIQRHIRDLRARIVLVT